ncbi:MAG: hypothetical protein WCQ80_03035 [Bacilli bacterium]
MELLIAKKSFIPVLSTGIWVVLLTIFVFIPNNLGECFNIAVIVILGLLCLDILYTLLRPFKLIGCEGHTFIIYWLWKKIVIDFNDIVKLDFYKATRRGYELDYGTILIFKNDNKRIRIPEIAKVMDVYFVMDSLMDEYVINNT